MNLKPIFVTCALALITATVAATSAPKNPVHEGNQKLAQLEHLRQELASANLDLGEIRNVDSQLVNVETVQHDWDRYSRVEIQRLKGQLQSYLRMVDQLLAIDRQKLVYIDHKDVLLQRQQIAKAYLTSLEQTQNGLNKAK